MDAHDADDIFIRGDRVGLGALCVADRIDVVDEGMQIAAVLLFKADRLLVEQIEVGLFLQRGMAGVVVILVIGGAQQLAERGKAFL